MCSFRGPGFLPSKLSRQSPTYIHTYIHGSPILKRSNITSLLQLLPYFGMPAVCPNKTVLVTTVQIIE